MITMEMLGKIRRMHLRDRLSLHEITKRTGLSRNTIRRWLRAPGETAPPTYRRDKRPSKLTAFHAALEQALKADSHRAAHPGSTLANLYDPNAMPDDLCRAHKALCRAVDAAYAADGGKKTWADDAERVGFLFQRYAALTSLVGDSPAGSDALR